MKNIAIYIAVLLFVVSISKCIEIDTIKDTSSNKEVNNINIPMFDIHAGTHMLFYPEIGIRVLVLKNVSFEAEYAIGPVFPTSKRYKMYKIGTNYHFSFFPPLVVSLNFDYRDEQTFKCGYSFRLPPFCYNYDELNTHLMIGYIPLNKPGLDVYLKTGVYYNYRIDQSLQKKSKFFFSFNLGLNFSFSIF